MPASLWLPLSILRSQEIQELPFLIWYWNKNSIKHSSPLKISNFDYHGLKPTDKLLAVTGFDVLLEVILMDSNVHEEEIMGWPHTDLWNCHHLHMPLLFFFFNYLL